MSENETVRPCALSIQNLSFSYPDPKYDTKHASSFLDSALEQQSKCASVEEVDAFDGVGSQVSRECLHSTSSSQLLNDCVLNNVSLTVEQGDFVLLTGNTGSGKTTLLRLCKPEIAPAGTRTGTISVFGTSVELFDSYTSATTVGYVAQNPESQIACDTVWHQLALGLENVGVEQKSMQRRVAETANFFGIEPWFHGLCDELSGGQQQILNLASTMVLQPQLLLLDEPTAMLDPIAEKNFLHALFRLNRELGITFMVATHQPEIMMPYATRRVCLEDGFLCERTLPSKPLIYAEGNISIDSAATREESPVVNGCITKGKPKKHSTAWKVQCAKRKPTVSTKTFISLDTVYVRYPEQEHFVLDGFSLDIEQGSIHMIVGGNGCGKTTLLKTIAGICKPKRGVIKTGAADNQVFLPQNPKMLLVCDSVIEEMQLWQQNCGYSQEDINQALCLFGLQRVVRKHPFDISGGQQQLLALAKLHVTNPDLYLLDEPTKGLDAHTKVIVAKYLLDAVVQGKTVVCATHDLSFANYVASHITLMFDGKAVCTQPPREFFMDNMFYRPVYDEFAQIMS